MSEGIIIALITAIGSLLGAVIGQIITASATIKAAEIKEKVQLNSREEKKPISWKVMISGAVLGAIVTLIALYFSGLVYPPQTVITPTPTSTNTTTPSSEFYDDFTNTNYENKFNDELWSIWGGNVNYSTKIIQQNGMLVLADSAPVIGEGVILYLQNWNEYTFSSFEAKLKIQQTSGRASISISTLSDSLPNGDAGIGIQSNSSPSTIEVWYGGQKITTRVAQYDTWYLLQIKFNEQNKTFEYYIDAKLIDSEILPSGLSNFTPVIQLWHTPGSEVTAYVKEVKIRK